MHILMKVSHLINHVSVVGYFLKGKKGAEVKDELKRHIASTQK